MNQKTKELALQSLIAALYVVVTFAMQAFSFGAEQFRISEFLIIVVLFSPKNMKGIIIGTLLANLFSPVGIIDIVVGTSATALACFLMVSVKNRYFSYLMPAVINGVIIGLMLYLVMDLPLVASSVSVFVSELIVTFIPWIIVGNTLLKNDKLREIFE